MNKIRLATATLAAFAATSAFAFEFNDDPTSNVTRTSPPEDLQWFIDTNNRPTGISVAENQGAVTQVTANWISNLDSHYKKFTLLWDQTAAQLNALPAQGYYIHDVEGYRKNNARYYAVIAIHQSSDPVATRWFDDLTSAQVAAQLSSFQGRLMELDVRFVDGQPRYTGVMRKNVGDDSMGWYWLTNATANQIEEFISEKKTRLVDICQRPDGRYAAVFWNDNAGPYRYFAGTTMNEAATRAGYWGYRIQCFNETLVNGQALVSGVMVNTKNALTRKIGDLMRASTDGNVGCYLNRLGFGYGELIDLQENSRFYPSSTNKVFLHAAAIWNTPNAQLNTRLIPVWANHTNPDHSGQTPTNTPLPNVLNPMMINSSNQMANACLDFWGSAYIDSTAKVLFNTHNDTQFLSRYGVQAPYTDPTPSSTTLFDLGQLYDKVRTVFDATKLAFFRDNMLNQSNSTAFDSLINQERMVAGLTTRQFTAWRSRYAWTAKAGNNAHPVTGINGYSSIAGWIRLPFRSGSQVQVKEYVFGNWINGAVQKNTLGPWVIAREQLRDEVRKSMETFKD